MTDFRGFGFEVDGIDTRMTHWVGDEEYRAAMMSCYVIGHAVYVTCCV